VRTGNWRRPPAESRAAWREIVAAMVVAVSVRNAMILNSGQYRNVADRRNSSIESASGQHLPSLGNILAEHLCLAQ
jgi:hypothetical protein